MVAIPAKLRHLREQRGRAAPDSGVPLVDHLIELRERILKSVIAVVGGSVACWFLYPAIFDVLVDPYCDLQGASTVDCRLLQTEPLEGFSMRLRIAGYGGIGLAMPVLLWQMWRFVMPGLHRHEKRWAYPFVASSLVLFVLGAALAFHSLTPALEFLVDVGGPDLQQQFRPAPYLELVTYMMLAFGVGFEFPILLVFLQLSGVVSSTSLRAARRYAVVAIIALVAVITPSGDPYTLGMLSIPMYLFYEASIVIGLLVTRRRRRAGTDTGG